MRANNSFPLFFFLLVTLLIASNGIQAEEIQGSYWYAVDNLSTAREGSRAVVWVVLPGPWQGQEFEVTAIEPAPVAVLEDKSTGNRVIEWVFETDGDSLPKHKFFHFDFQLKESKVGYDVLADQVGTYDRSAVEFQAYTQPETWIQTNGKILDQARLIIGTEKNPWLQTRALFAWCLGNLEFIPGGFEGRDAQATLASRKGDCGQMSRLLVGFCRSIGIPARTITCEWLTGGSHVFAEILIPDFGWVPADVSLAQMLLPEGGGFTETEVANFMSVRGVPLGDPFWFLGNLFSHRLIVAVGNNITVDSPTLGKKITFQSMKPGGNKAYPAAFRMRGFNTDLIHGGFFVFDEKVRSDDDAHKMTHMRLAKQFFNVGLYDVVEEGCRKSINQYSDGVQPWINLGKVYMHKGEYYKAEAAFKRAMRGSSALRKDKLEARVWTHNYLGNCYDLLGHRDMAVEQYNRVLGMENDYRGALGYAKKYLKEPFRKEAPRH